VIPRDEVLAVCPSRAPIRFRLQPLVPAACRTNGCKMLLDEARVDLTTAQTNNSLNMGRMS
jgi:hypothetical protein